MVPVQTPNNVSRPPPTIPAIPKAIAMSFSSLLRFSGESAPSTYHEPHTMPPTPARANSTPHHLVTERQHDQDEEQREGRNEGSACCPNCNGSLIPHTV